LLNAEIGLMAQLSRDFARATRLVFAATLDASS